MHAREIRVIAVIGAGLMGHGIAQDFAAHGYDVRLYARSQERLDQALQNIEIGPERLQRLGRLTAAQAAATPARIRTGTTLEVLVHDADLVIEAVSEDLELKQQFFRSLDRACPPRIILASTTSALLPSALANATHRPDRVLVTHYFNPPSIVPLVEFVRGPETSDETVAPVRDLLLRMGKRPAVAQTEVPGFIGNRLQAALLREALSLVEHGVATPADIDSVIKYSFGPRLAVAGVFQIGDLAGLDLYLSVGRLLFPALESSPEVPRVLRERVEQGQLGAKTGQGSTPGPPSRRPLCVTGLLKCSSSLQDSIDASRIIAPNSGCSGCVGARADATPSRSKRSGGAAQRLPRRCRSLVQCARASKLRRHLPPVPPR